MNTLNSANIPEPIISSTDTAFNSGVEPSRKRSSMVMVKGESELDSINVVLKFSKLIKNATILAPTNAGFKCLPQVISMSKISDGDPSLQIRVTKPVKGRVLISSKSGEVYTKTINALPERRVLLTLFKAEIALIRER